MRMPALIFAVVLAISAVPVAAQAQDAPSGSAVVVTGSRVRVMSTVATSRLEGLVVALDYRVVTLATNSGIVTIPLTSITATERSLGRKRNGLKGTAIGAVIGLVLGLTLSPEESGGLCGFNYGTGSPVKCSRGQAAGMMLAGGAAWGALFGALIQTERWSPVTLSAANAPTPSGRPAFRIGVAVRF